MCYFGGFHYILNVLVVIMKAMFVLFCNVALPSEFRVLISDFHLGVISVRPLPPVVCGIWGGVHGLCTLYVFSYSGVQHILCCVIVLFFFVLCVLCFQFLKIVYFN